MKCRFCNHCIETIFVDLANSPPSNSYLTLEQLSLPEIYYPLKVMVCENCFLVQIDKYKKPTEIFNNNYAYFSSYSTSWLEHCMNYVEFMIEEFNLNLESKVIEISSNDGYLLKYFKDKNIPVLGIEPSSNTAEVAVSRGIETIVDFFGVQLAEKLINAGKKANLIIGNNVLAHVPDIHDFVGGLKILLEEDGIITMEFPHLHPLVLNNYFDTIYHEHFSYLSFTIAKKIFESKGLEIFNIQEIPTHGGSLRIYAKHINDNKKPINANVGLQLIKEQDAGISKIEYYSGFQVKTSIVKNEIIEFLIQQKRADKKVIAYGAAAKGNTFLNYCGIKSDLVKFVVDASPHKQSKYLPGSHIPIFGIEKIFLEKPDYVLILPWNIQNEIIQQLSHISSWGGKFVVAIPNLKIIA